MSSIDIFGTLAPAALYFSNEGQYIFRTKTSEGVITTKCVSARDVAQAFTGEDQDTGWLPAGILRAGYGPKGPWFVYSRPPTTMMINLVQPKGPHFQAVPVPGTLLVGIGREYMIFSWAGDQFRLDDPICTAPYPNVHSDGQICWGKNVAPEAAPQNAEIVWRLFFDAPFNGDLVNGKCKRFPQDVRKLLRKLKGVERFPDEELITIEQNAGKHIERLIEQEAK